MKQLSIGVYTVIYDNCVELSEKKMNHISWRLSKGDTQGTIAREEGDNITWKGDCE